LTASRIFEAFPLAFLGHCVTGTNHRVYQNVFHLARVTLTRPRFWVGRIVSSWFSPVRQRSIPSKSRIRSFKFTVFGSVICRREKANNCCVSLAARWAAGRVVPLCPSPTHLLVAQCYGAVSPRCGSLRVCLEGPSMRALGPFESQRTPKLLPFSQTYCLGPMCGFM